MGGKYREPCLPGFQFGVTLFLTHSHIEDQTIQIKSLRPGDERGDEPVCDGLLVAFSLPHPQILPRFSPDSPRVHQKVSMLIRGISLILA